MRLIDADALDEAIVKESEGYKGSVYSCGISDGLALARECVEEAQTADAQLIVHGKWISFFADQDSDMFECSNCKVFVRLPFKMREMNYEYCPGCGAKMK